ncbi:MAG: DUF4149 domain-containing protein [Hydrogenophaga sp.]|uniref:DUF4149 domain-containing protein n=1 Tax=Hydrogenophaga sp. TaxID=1904254 RepID=UPI0016B8030D|nr:DUF4149 domain-containing protein [Hydrogenophaga sp.]NIM43595.1 DUF4149 domain-containing protein [Hydrogenophaga sp.]NIN28664.1 DUF4149 domain-containing protein [Hydrogenophaga sp.]NIN33123.1 DUF4149 domain-containing protein [Hydrogenophaga sp.]NIN57798.1 DUF4149 domain-containing protein [Hydrogenophaga sp.]NIO54093.1 DUF4149 domain-containing protein [Hydrogenophaga sp.]
MRLQRPALMLAAVWWGGITALSFLAVPTLFASLGPAVAGPVAAKLFSLQCWAGVVIGAVLLVIVQRDGPGGDNAALLALVCLGLMLALVQEFGVAQKIVTARASGGNLKLWHGVGTALVAGQWLCSGALLWRLSRPRPAIDQPA